MTNLDDTEAIKKRDSANVLGSIEQLGDQCKQAWDDVQNLTLPDNYKNVTSIVFSGMGGSALGAYVVKSLFFRHLKVPFEIVNDYHLPPYISKDTLVILGSYSGTTEETLSSALEAIKASTCAVGITTGGKLEEMLAGASFPYYKITPTHNPSNQPRLGTGYSVFGQIAILTKLGFLDVRESDVSHVYEQLRQGHEKYGIQKNVSENSTKQLALSLNNKIPIIVGAEFLSQVGRVIRNQLHESAKSYADYHIIPELNHHLMEGLTNPNTNKNTLAFLFLTSSLYTEAIKKRMNITREVVQKQDIVVYEFTPTSNSALTQALESIQFGAYVNYYLAMLYGVDPSSIPWVTYFKENLAKMST